MLRSGNINNLQLSRCIFIMMNGALSILVRELVGWENFALLRRFTLSVYYREYCEQNDRDLQERHCDTLAAAHAVGVAIEHAHMHPRATN